MLYDKYVGVPPRGSPLESIFCIVSSRRQNAIAQGIMVLVAGFRDSKETPERFQEFLSSMFPYLQGVEERQNEEAREALMDLVGKRLSIDTTQIGRPERSSTRMVSREATERFRIQPKIPGA